LNTARELVSGFSLDGFGYTAGGFIAAVSAVTEKYDDVANTWTAKANLNTARSGLAGFSQNGYGYIAGGFVAAVSAVTEKYDGVANVWTAKANLNTARTELSGFSLGALQDGVQLTDITPVYHVVRKFQEMRGQTSKTLNASGRASLVTSGDDIDGVIVVPWTSSFIANRLVTKPATSKVTLEFKLLNASGRMLNASIRTVSFYYEFVREN